MNNLLYILEIEIEQLFYVCQGMLHAKSSFPMWSS